MVRIVGIETVQQDFPAIGPVVAVIVGQQHQVGLLRDVDAFGREFESEREVQPVGEHRHAVRPAVAVRVLEDQELVVGFAVAGAPMGVRRRHRDPEAAAVVERHLDRIAQFGKLGLGREQVDLESFGKLEPLDGALHVEELDGQIEIGPDFRKRQRLRRVIHRRSVGPARQFVNASVPQRRHLADLEDLLRVVLHAERLDAPSVDVDVVQHPVVVEPVPVLVPDRVVERT